MSTPRTRLERIARGEACQSCDGTGIARVAHNEGGPFVAQHAPLDKITEALDEIARRRRMAAERVPPAQRTAQEWAAVEADRPTGPLVVSVLDALAAEGDAALADAARRYLAAVGSVR